MTDSRGAETLDPHLIASRMGIRGVRFCTYLEGRSRVVNWRIDTDSDSFVLRIYPDGDHPALARESEAMRLARAAGVVAPEIVTSGEDDGHPLMLYRWVPGTTLWDACALHRLRFRSLARRFGRMHALIHSIGESQPHANVPEDLLSLAGYQPDRVREALGLCGTSARTLVHLDYHQLNVLSDGRSIKGVVDWANARFADPRADYARTYTMLLVEPYVPGLQPVTLAAARRLLASGWRRGYEEVRGRQQGLEPFFAWAGSFMSRDLARRVADPDSWFARKHLAAIQRWTEGWLARCGV
jgi:aminoglycoside phosphotransferase (APT) family kinase protein